jgi:hypothetical protein
MRSRERQHVLVALHCSRTRACDEALCVLLLLVLTDPICTGKLSLREGNFYNRIGDSD